MKKLVSIISVIIIFSLSANAQGWLKQLGNAAKNAAKGAVERRVEQKAEQAADNAMDTAEKSVKKSGGKNNKQVSETNDENSPTEEGQDQDNAVSNGNKNTNPTLQSYSKFDFIPGEKVIFFDDFSQDAVGDFPALWFSDGSGEVVTLNNFTGKWLNIKSPGCYYPERNLETGENFTVEFDMIPQRKEINSFNIGLYLVSGNIKDPGEGGAIPGVAGVKTYIEDSRIDLSSYADGEYKMDASGDGEIKLNEKNHFSYWIQKSRMRIYVNETKIVDAPRIVPAGYKFNILRFEIGEGDQPLVSNFRVAAGLPDMRNKLLTEGKLVSYGIYFDVNKADVKPESYGTLKEIAKVLSDNPSVRVKIVGHTDSDGEDAKNLDLSKKRGESVKNELVKTFGIDASRLESDGKGETQPVASNDTPANKALNRRVEFIKIN